MSLINIESLRVSFEKAAAEAQKHDLPVVADLDRLVIQAMEHNEEHHQVSSRLQSLWALGQTYALEGIVQPQALEEKRTQYKMEIGNNIRTLRLQLTDTALRVFHSGNEHEGSVYWASDPPLTDVAEFLRKEPFKEMFKGRIDLPGE